MTQDDEKFLDRWSRRKREAAQVPEKQPEAPVPELPPVEKLTPDSDFSGFMHPKVDDALRRVALKTLFRDPRFNVPDPFEAYSGDWTGGEPISEEMLATLNQARTLLFNKEEGKEEGKEEKKEHEQPAPQDESVAEKPKDDEPGRQDT